MAIAFSACGSDVDLTPTRRPTRIPFPTPTQTKVPPTPVDTATPRPTATPILIHIPEGGYHFAPPLNYQIDYQGYITNLADQKFEVWYTIAGILEPIPFETAQEVIFEFVTQIDTQDNVSIDLGEYYEFAIDGVVGMAADFTGTILADPTEGLAVAVIINQNHFFFAIATSKNNETWLEEGRQNFETMLASIQFDSSSVQAGDACEVSTDATYGYTKENPIKVGGGAFDGPARERAFLDTLRGPNGEGVEYYRLGSEDGVDTILDAYQVSFLGQDSVVLYMDEYSYEDLKAPVGFTCASNFPITAP